MKLLYRTIGLVVAFFVIFITNSASVNAAVPGDANGDNKVDGVDYTRWLNNYNTSTSLGASVGDFNSNGTVDGVDYTIWLNNYGYVPPPTNPPGGGSTGWNQFGGNAQRTSYSSEIVATPWKYKWQWNGADNSGKAQSSHLLVPDLVQPIAGDNKIFMIANNTVYALNKTDGSVAWSRGSIGTLTATPAFDGGFLYVPSSNNNLYKLSTSNGSISGTLNLGGALSFAALNTTDRIYVTSSNGMLYAVNKSNFTKAWEYNGQSSAQTPPSYSASRNIIIFGTQDLNIHAVNASGTQKWRVKPTTRTPGDPGASAGNSFAELTRSWPVVADSQGIVLIRYRLDWNTLWTGNPFPTSNSAIRSLLGDNNKRPLYALSLDSGQPAFYPAVGNAASGDGDVFQMGPMPVVATMDGKQVAYVIWRNGLTCQGSSWCDGREDATMGEMVLDGSTVSGYAAGDVRFVKFTDIQTDEAMFLSMGGKILIHNHWLSAQMHQISDRSASRGGSFSNPISTSNAPFVTWRQVYCSAGNSQCNPQTCPGCTGTSYGPSNCPFNAATRYCSSGTYTYGDSRQYPAGFYEYHNDTSPRSSRSLPFVVPLSDMMVVKTHDGAIMALVNGNPTANAGATTQLAQSAPESVLGAVAPSYPLPYEQAEHYIGQWATFTGKIASAENNRPKAIYLGFKDPHDGALLVRIFEKDLAKFNYDPMTLKGKTITVHGFVTIYGPESGDPEIVVSDPKQIEIE